MTDPQQTDESAFKSLSPYERMMVEIQQWNLRSREDQIHIDQRQYGIEFTRRNADFDSLLPDLQRLLGSGDTGDFEPLAPEDQYITPQLGVSRKVTLRHPKYPEQQFCISGPGRVSLDEHKRIRIEPPDTSMTVAALADQKGLPSNVNEVYGVDRNGKDITRRGNDPLGAYWLKSAEDKYDMTVEAQMLLQQSEHAQACVPVAAGKYVHGEGEAPAVGFFVYAMPADAVALPRMLQGDAVEIAKQLGIGGLQKAITAALRSKYAIASFNTTAGIRLLHDQDRVHREGHPGNIFVRPDGKVVITDWNTMQDISDHRTKRDSRLKMSPKDKAKWEDVRLNLVQTTAIQNIDTIKPIISQVALVAGMLGYNQPPQEEMLLRRRALLTEFSQVYAQLMQGKSKQDMGATVDQTIEIILETWKRATFTSATR